jgi:hypothetical protein
VAAGFVLWRFMKIRSGIATGNPAFDQFQSRISVGILWKFLPGSLDPDRGVQLGRAVMAILHNETPGGWDGQTVVTGDLTTPLGPSVGPMQVLRATAVDLGLVPTDEPQETYLARASNLDWCIEAGLTVFKSKLDAAGGDIAEAIRRYNGSGDAAESYKRNALTWLDSTYGEGAIGAPPAALA